jgi:predicted Zn-dependent protease
MRRMPFRMPPCRCSAWRAPLSRRAALALPAALLAEAPAAAQPGGRITLIRDAETETLLRTFANPLFRAAGVEPNLVRIIVIRDPAINSFVSTGNLMFVNTGLIMKADSAAELVGVLAHETGHVAGGHLARLPDAMREMLIESIAAMLIGAAAGAASRGSGAGAGILGGQQLAQRNFLAFTRGMERAADQAAVRLLDANHWPATGMLRLFEQLEDQELLSASLQDPYLVTHPLTRERMAFVKHHVETSPYSDSPLPPAFEPGFRMVRAKLAGFLNPSSATLRAVRADDAAPESRYARSIALYRLGHLAEALPLIDGLIAQQPASPWLYELKGQMLFENGRGHDAIPAYGAAVRLAPEQALIRLALAQAMVETGEPAQLRAAIQQLQVALAREHDNAPGWRALGVAWGRLGEIGQANLALAEEALINGNIRVARGFAAKAQQQLPQGPSRLRAGDIANAVKKENRTGF